jgi:hypothetical protein
MRTAVIRIPEDAVEGVGPVFVAPEEGSTPSRFWIVACCIGVPVSEV